MLLCYVIDSGLSTSLLLLATLKKLCFTFTLHYISEIFRPELSFSCW